MAHFNFVISQNAKCGHAGFYTDCHRMTVPENILLQKKHWVAVRSLVNMTLFHAVYRVVDRPCWWSFASVRGTDQSQRHVLFCSLAVFDPRVGHTMDVLSPFISVLLYSDWLFHGESCPRLDVVHPGRAWSSSPTWTWHCSLHYLFLQATPSFPHGGP